ncbi:hypothetical protein L218DRAFT_1007220 [Marasmius fiardii PR-910]|nr:hypothetical protein L218DRAFT_1007220 [Marasmius fiardii PR-910]
MECTINTTYTYWWYNASSTTHALSSPSLALESSVTLAENPFSAMNTDAAFLTADGVIFPITMTCLSCISPYFGDLFANSTGRPPMIITNEQLHEELGTTVPIPVFRIEEESATFKNVLLYVYPGLATPSPNLGDLGPVITAMFKYKMDRTPAFRSGVIGRIHEVGTSYYSLLEDLGSWLASFLLLYRCKRLAPDTVSGDMIRAVGQRLLLFPFDDLALCHVPEIDLEPSLFPVRVFTTLLRYHRRYSNVILTHSPSFNEWPADSSQLKYRCDSLHPRVLESAISMENVKQVFYYLRANPEFRNELCKLSQGHWVDIDDAFGNDLHPILCSRCHTTACRTMVRHMRAIVEYEFKATVKDIRLELPGVNLDD